MGRRRRRQRKLGDQRQLRTPLHLLLPGIEGDGHFPGRREGLLADDGFTGQQRHTQVDGAGQRRDPRDGGGQLPVEIEHQAALHADKGRRGVRQQTGALAGRGAPHLQGIAAQPRTV